MNLDDVHTIGFDLDYTLVLYKGIDELLLFVYKPIFDVYSGAAIFNLQSR